MSGPGYLTIYSIFILLFSLGGGYLPFLGRVSHSRLQLYLSISAGVMLGASFFHIMPEAMEQSGAYFGWWMSLGVVGLFCIERFIAPHSHEVNGHHHHEDDECTHEHHSSESKTSTTHRAAPPVAGWAAVAGLTIHTFMNGVGLAGQVLVEESDKAAGLFSALPGFAIFLAIFLHKPADALAISTVLSRKKVSRNMIALVQFGFACMVPVGAAVFWVTQGAIRESLKSQLVGAALAFSAGTFLFIALSDLLPEVQFHRHDRVPLFLALVSGVAFMGGIALLEGHGGDEHDGHNHGGHVAPGQPGEKHDHHDDDGKDHGHDHKHEKEHK